MPGPGSFWKTRCAYLTLKSLALTPKIEKHTDCLRNICSKSAVRKWLSKCMEQPRHSSRVANAETLSLIFKFFLYAHIQMETSPKARYCGTQWENSTGSDWLQKMEDILCNHMLAEGAGNKTWFPFQINRQWNNQETVKVNEFSMAGTPAHHRFREGCCHKLQHQWWKTQVFCFIFHFLSHALLSVILTDIWRNASEFTEISLVLNYCNTDQIPAHCPWAPKICKMCDGLFLLRIYTLI